MTATRRQAREWAIQMITAADVNPPEDIPAFMASFWEEIALGLPDDRSEPTEVKGKLKAFAEERVTGVLSSLAEIDDVIKAFLENWDLYRLGTVERAVLRMGVWELKNTDVPRPVVINEAIDLVNWFSSPKSRQFVNGILDKYAKSLS